MNRHVFAKNDRESFKALNTVIRNRSHACGRCSSSAVGRLLFSRFEGVAQLNRFYFWSKPKRLLEIPAVLGSCGASSLFFLPLCFQRLEACQDGRAIAGSPPRHSSNSDTFIFTSRTESLHFDYYRGKMTTTVFQTN